MSRLFSPLLRRHRLQRFEIVYWLVAVAVFFIFPRNLALATSILVMALFALSLDLVLGFSGIVSFGHAVFFGVGAYAAGLLALGGYAEPISGAIIAGLVAGFVALLMGPVVIRASGLPQIMVTLAFAVIAYEFANKAVWLTRGDDGLGGIKLMPLLGVFQWTALGQTAYWYALGWLFVLFLLIRTVLSSPFGVALQGCRENIVRMRFIGTPVLGRLMGAYVLSGFVAGIAGAISCQTSKFAGLDTLSIDRSIDALVMLVLGGVGRLYGGLLGAPVYMLVRQIAAEWNPFHWMFVVGGLLVFVVMLARGGILGLLEAIAGRISSKLSGKR